MTISKISLAEYVASIEEQADTAVLCLAAAPDDAVVICAAAEVVEIAMSRYDGTDATPDDSRMLQIVGLQKFMDRYRLGLQASPGTTSSH